MILVAVLLLEVAALVGACLLARRDRAHRVVALLVAYALLDELVIAAMHHWIFTAPEHPVREAIARLGWPARVAYHVETALVLGWPAALAAASWSVFAAPPPVPRGPRSRTSTRARDLVFAVWAGAAVGMAGAFPLTEGRTAPALHAFGLLGVAAALAAVPVGWARTWGAAHASLLALAAVELAVQTIGPFVRSPFMSWRLAHEAYALGFAALAALHVRWLRRSTARR